MVKRYKEVFDPNHSQECICHRGPMNRGLEESPEGDFVDIEDYEELKNQLAKANEQLQSVCNHNATQQPEITKLRAELAKANERVERYKSAIDEECILWDFTVDEKNPRKSIQRLLDITDAVARDTDVNSKARKFAIGQQIEGLKDYQALCGFADCRKSIDARIAQLEEKLRKEQE